MGPALFYPALALALGLALSELLPYPVDRVVQERNVSGEVDDLPFMI